MCIRDRVLDKGYVDALMTHTDLSLAEAVLLDQIQKGHQPPANQLQRLRAKGLVEGRSPKPVSYTHLDVYKRQGLDDPLEVQHPDCPEGTRVLLWRITPAPQGMPVAWKGHYYGRAGETLCGLSLNKMDAIRAQSALHDWSAALVSDCLLYTSRCV